MQLVLHGNICVNCQKEQFYIACNSLQLLSLHCLKQPQGSFFDKICSSISTTNQGAFTPFYFNAQQGAFTPVKCAKKPY